MKKQEQQIEEALTRGVEKILPSKESLAELMKKRKVRLYNGIDPTSPKMHIGNTVPLIKLRQFQDLGHKVVLLVGTFTARIGDPSGHEEARKTLSEKEIKENIKAYKKQAANILDFSKVEMVYNHEWLQELTMSDFIKLAANFSVQEIIKRDLFQRRLEKERPVWLNEFIYPLFQGYDSVCLDVDLEVGGTDQTFNMLVGRKLQKIYNEKEKFVLSLPLIPGLDGRKMSKTFGNTINLEDGPNEMFGKVMSLKDKLILLYFEMCTLASQEKIGKVKKQLNSEGVNPRDVKGLLARAIVSLHHGEKAAQKAEKEFNRIFKEDKPPTDIPEFKIKEDVLPLLDLLVELELTSSKSKAKRLVQQGGVRVNGEVQEDWQKEIKPQKGMVVAVGKRRFAKIV